MAGSPSTVMLSCPHWQVAVRIPWHPPATVTPGNNTATSRLGKKFWLMRSNGSVSSRSLRRCDLELAGDVAALLRQTAEAVSIALHFIDMRIAFIVQRPQ